MQETIKAPIQMICMSLAGWSISKTEIRFAVEMICLLTPVVLSVLLFIRNGKKKKEKNDVDGK